MKYEKPSRPGLFNRFHLVPQFAKDTRSVRTGFFRTTQTGYWHLQAGAVADADASAGAGVDGNWMKRNNLGKAGSKPERAGGPTRMRRDWKEEGEDQADRVKCGNG